MHANEYQKLRKKYLGSQDEAAKILGCSRAAITDRERRRDGETVTPASELALLRAVAARLLGLKALTPRIKPPVSAKRKAVLARLVASNTRSGRATTPTRSRGRAVPATLLPGFNQRADAPATPDRVGGRLCAFVDSGGRPCLRAVEALPGALLCPAHGIEASFLGRPRFR